LCFSASEGWPHALASVFVMPITPYSRRIC
jgi:hypothetical protein